MNNVIDLATIRAAKKLASKPEIDTIQIITECLNDVSSIWQQQIQNNTLNRYFFETVKAVVVLDRILNASISDLNILTKIEFDLKLVGGVFGPGATTANPTGWIAGFKANDKTFSSPEMASEAAARTFCILLFLRFSEVMKSLT